MGIWHPFTTGGLPLALVSAGSSRIVAERKVWFASLEDILLHCLDGE